MLHCDIYFCFFDRAKAEIGLIRNPCTDRFILFTFNIAVVVYPIVVLQLTLFIKFIGFKFSLLRIVFNVGIEFIKTHCKNGLIHILDTCTDTNEN